VRPPDLSALAVGVAIVLLGALLLLHEEGTLDIDGGWLAAVVTGCAGAALLASGLGAREP
jgi:hypothetical protein